MKLDSIRIKSERRKKAWSQEHLAGASGLGLRTIQRIEKSGVASYESVRALAAVFSLPVEELTESSVNQRRRKASGIAAAGLLTTVLLGLAGGFYTKSSWAEYVMLDVGISQNDEEMTEGQLLTAEGEEAEMRVNGAIRLVVVPTIQDDGKVFLSAEIYEMIDGNYILALEPKLVTANHKEAEIRIDSESGNSFKVLVTPHRSD